MHAVPASPAKSASPNSEAQVDKTTGRPLWADYDSARAALSPLAGASNAQHALGAIVQLGGAYYEHHGDLVYEVTKAGDDTRATLGAKGGKIHASFVRKRVVTEPGVKTAVLSSLGFDPETGKLSASTSKAVTTELDGVATTDKLGGNASVGLDGELAAGLHSSTDTVEESAGDTIKTHKGASLEATGKGVVIRAAVAESVATDGAVARSQNAAGFVGTDETGFTGGVSGAETIVDKDLGQTTKRDAKLEVVGGHVGASVNQSVVQDIDGDVHSRKAGLSYQETDKGAQIGGGVEVTSSTTVEDGGATVLEESGRHANASLGPDGHLVDIGASRDQVELRDGQVVRRSNSAGLKSNKDHTIVKAGTEEFVGEGDKTHGKSATGFAGIEHKGKDVSLTGGFAGSDIVVDPETGLRRERKASLSYKDGKVAGEASDVQSIEMDGVNTTSTTFIKGAQGDGGANSWEAGKGVVTNEKTATGEVIATNRSVGMSGSNDGLELKGAVGDSVVSDELKKSNSASANVGLHKGKVHGGFKGASSHEADGKTVTKEASLGVDKETGEVVGGVKLNQVTEVEGISDSKSFELSRDAKGTGRVAARRGSSGEEADGRVFNESSGVAATIDKDNNVEVVLDSSSAKAVSLDADGAEHVTGKKGSLAVGNKGVSLTGSTVEGISDGAGNNSVEEIGGTIGLSDKGLVVGANGKRVDNMADGSSRERAAGVKLNGSSLEANLSEVRKGPDGQFGAASISAKDGALTAGIERGQSVERKDGSKANHKFGAGATLDADGNAAVMLGGSAGNSRKVVGEDGETKEVGNSVSGGVVIMNNGVGGNIGIKTDQGESASISGMAVREDGRSITSGEAAVGFGPVSFAVGGGVVCVFSPPAKKGDQWVVNYSLTESANGSLGVSNDTVGGKVEAGTSGTRSGTKVFEGPNAQHQAIAFFKAQKVPAKDVSDAFGMNVGESAAKGQNAHYGASGNLGAGGVSINAGFKVGESTHVKVTKSSPDMITVVFTKTDSLGGNAGISGGGASLNFSKMSAEFGSVTATFSGNAEGVAAYKEFLRSGTVKAPGKVVSRREGTKETDGVNVGLAGAKLDLSGSVSETTSVDANGEKTEDRVGDGGVSLTAPKVNIAGVEVLEGGTYSNKDSLKATQVNDGETQIDVVGEVEAGDAKSAHRALAEKMNLTGAEHKIDEDAKSSGKWTVESGISPAQRAAFVRAAKAGKFNSKALIYKSGAGEALVAACRSGSQDTIDRAFAEFAKNAGAKGIALIRRTVAETGGPAATEFDLTLQGDEFFKGRAGRANIEARIKRAEVGLAGRGDRRAINKDMLALLAHLNSRMAALVDKSRYQDLPPAARRTEVKRTKGWLARVRTLRRKIIGKPKADAGVKAREAEREDQHDAEKKRGADLVNLNVEDARDLACEKTEVDLHEEREGDAKASLMTPEQMALGDATRTLGNFRRAVAKSKAKMDTWQAKYNWMYSLHRGENYGRAGSASPRKTYYSKAKAGYDTADRLAAQGRKTRETATVAFNAFTTASGMVDVDPDNLAYIRGTIRTATKANAALQDSGTAFKRAYDALQKIRAKYDNGSRVWTGYSKRDREPG